MSEVARFPVEQVMSTRVAEEKIGGMLQYKYPEKWKLPVDPEEWMKRWMTKKFVLLGWDVVKKGIVPAFKTGRSRHLVRHVYSDYDGGKRPRVQTYCSLSTYPIWNWKAREIAKKVPAIILSEDQASYFQLCKRCEMLLIKMGQK